MNIQIHESRTARGGYGRRRRPVRRWVPRQPSNPAPLREEHGDEVDRPQDNAAPVEEEKVVEMPNYQEEVSVQQLPEPLVRGERLCHFRLVGTGLGLTIGAIVGKSIVSLGLKRSKEFVDSSAVKALALVGLTSLTAGVFAYAGFRCARYLEGVRNPLRRWFYTPKDISQVVREVKEVAQAKGLDPEFYSYVASKATMAGTDPIAVRNLMFRSGTWLKEFRPQMSEDQKHLLQNATVASVLAHNPYSDHLESVVGQPAAHASIFRQHALSLGKTPGARLPSK